MGSSSGTLLAQAAVDREHWLSAPALLAYLNIRYGMQVAELGAGTAFYALPIGHRVGPDGRVFAVEWRPWLMDELHARLAGRDAPRNVRLVESRAADTPLPAASCDLVILADIWHEFEHQDAVLDEARRILRTDGHLAILNWRPDASVPPGPPVEHRISMQRTIQTVELKSWSLVNAERIGTDGYLLVFEITDESVQS